MTWCLRHLIFPVKIQKEWVLSQWLSKTPATHTSLQVKVSIWGLLAWEMQEQASRLRRLNNARAGHQRPLLRQQETRFNESNSSNNKYSHAQQTRLLCKQDLWAAETCYIMNILALW